MSTIEKESAAWIKALRRRAEKEATGRIKDKESLPRLKAFRDWWMKNRG